MARRSCSRGSCGNGRPVFSCTTAFSSETRARSASAGRSASVRAFARALAASSSASRACRSMDSTTSAEQGDEAAVAVPREAVVPGPLRQPLHRLVVQTEVEDGVHHARHGRPRSGAHRDQERARRIAEAAPRGGLEPGQVGEDLLPQPGGMLLAGRVVGGPGLGGDREAGRHRHPQLRHLGQLAPLATQQRPQGARSVRLAVRERVDVLGSASGSGSSSPAGGLSTSGHQRPPQQLSGGGREKDTGPDSGLR